MPSKKSEKKPTPEKEPIKEQEEGLQPEEVVIEFDRETDSIRQQQTELERQIVQREKAQQENIESPIIQEERYRALIEKDITEMRTHVDRLDEEIQRRGPTPEEENLEQEIQDIDRQITQYEKTKQENLANPTLPSSITEKIDHDIEESEKQKQEKLQELQDKKLERIKKYQQETKQEEPEESEEPEEKKEPEEEPKKEKKEEKRETEQESKTNALEIEVEQRRKEIEGLQESGADESEIENREKELEELLKKRQELAEKATDRNLDEETRKELKDEYGERYRRISKKDYIREQLTRIGERRRTRSFKKQWEELPTKQQKHIYGNFEEFVKALEEKRRENQQRTGEDLPRDVFCALLNSGYRPQEIKKVGLFRKKIVIPRQGGKPLRMSVEKFRQFVTYNETRIRERRIEKARETWERARTRAKKAEAGKIETKIQEIADSSEYRDLSQEYMDEREELQKKEEPQEVEEELEEEKTSEELGKEARERRDKRLEKLEAWKKNVENKFGIAKLEYYSARQKSSPELAKLAVALQKKQEEINQEYESMQEQQKQNTPAIIEELEQI